MDRQRIICADCSASVGKDPATGDWAAWDAPPYRIDTGKRLEDGTIDYQLVSRTETALCSECYTKAFQTRYPGEEPPVLYDGRIVEKEPNG